MIRTLSVFSLNIRESRGGCLLESSTEQKRETKGYLYRIIRSNLLPKLSNKKSRYISPFGEIYRLITSALPFELRTQRERGALLKSDFLHDTLALLAYHYDVVSTAEVEGDRFVSVSFYKHLAFEVVNKYVSAIEP